MPPLSSCSSIVQIPLLVHTDVVEHARPDHELASFWVEALGVIACSLSHVAPWHSAAGHVPLFEIQGVGVAIGDGLGGLRAEPFKQQIILGDVHRQQVGRRVTDREELRDVVRADEELGVMLLDAIDPALLDSTSLV